MADGKSGTKAGGPRTEVFAMRLDPKLKYLAEIAARKQRRSLANFVEWAIEQSLPRVYLQEPGSSGEGETVTDAASKLWELDESDRLVRLAEHFPELLTYDEQLIWRVITTYALYENKKEIKVTIRFKEKDDVVLTGLIRKCWKEIKAFALGNISREELDSAVCKVAPHVICGMRY